MTLEMYANRKKIPLEGVDVQLNHDKVYAKDCAECVELDKGDNTLIDKFERVSCIFRLQLINTVEVKAQEHIYTYR